METADLLFSFQELVSYAQSVLQKLEEASQRSSDGGQ